MSSRANAPAAAMLGLFAAGTIGLATPAASSPTPPATPPATPVFALTAWDIPMDVPAEPASSVPTTDELSGLLYALADPGVSALAKGGLVEGGIGAGEAVYADRAFSKANNQGYLPLEFSVANVQPTGPGKAASAVTITGPKTSAYTTTINFVDQDGWKISKASAVALMQAASGKAGR